MPQKPSKESLLKKKRMKKFIIFFCLILLPFISQSRSAEWKEVQVVVIPRNIPLYYTFNDNGDVKYCVKFNEISVNVAKGIAQKFLNGECELELVKWYSVITGKYKYTVRKHNPKTKDIDLNTITFMRE